MTADGSPPEAVFITHTPPRVSLALLIQELNLLI